MNFTSLRREVKVYQSVIKGRKGKSVKNKTEQEESRIDFELYWDDNVKNLNIGGKIENESGNELEKFKDTKRKKKIKTEGDTKEIIKINMEEINLLSKNNTVSVEISENNSDSINTSKLASSLNIPRTMLLEVKSVTLAMQTEKGEVRIYFDKYIEYKE